MKTTSSNAENEYRVTWAIDITAAGFRQAAEHALQIQRQPESIATVFEVTCSATGVQRTVHLSDEGHAPGETLCCLVCGDSVAPTRLRDHLCGHNPNADGLEWADVRAQFCR